MEMTKTNARREQNEMERREKADTKTVFVRDGKTFVIRIRKCASDSSVALK